jgi:hypothetical protein
MNTRHRTRVQELAWKAGLPTYNPDGIPTKLDKFAELIIQECIMLNQQELTLSEFKRLTNRYREFWELS